MLVTKNNLKFTLVLLWLTILIFMVFADVLSLMVLVDNKAGLDLPVKASLAMFIASFALAIPILMPLATWVLQPKWVGKINIIGSLFTIFFVVAGGSTIPHYLVIASFEVLLLGGVFYLALKWQKLE